MKFIKLSCHLQALVVTNLMLNSTTFWDDIGEHLYFAIKYFFDNASLPRSWGKTYITLIPKKNNLAIVNDYRLISLCNVCYKLMSWTTILATLTKMKFPGTWISWIHACISSASFSFVINKKPFPWFSSHRGLRQGDLISSYLFILVSQNLTTLLNFALRNQMIPGFNPNLRHNFNHLMYADGLILISHDSRKVARNIKLCFSIFENLTSQCANNSKSEIFFPSHFNCRLKKSICDILDFKVGSFPFIYIKILISHEIIYPFLIFLQWWTKLTR